jgi:ribonuclease D
VPGHSIVAVEWLLSIRLPNDFWTYFADRCGRQSQASPGNGRAVHDWHGIFPVNPQFISTPEQLLELCQLLSQTDLLAFDTEFVAEDSYRPELCLIQVSSRDCLAVIDPLTCGPLDEFWQLLLEPQRRVVVHSGREEVLFCYRATGKLIPSLFDIQVAAGFVGLDYPASYGNLVQRFTGKVLDKEETRSDWRRRPLSARQLRYASQDVRDLPDIYELLRERLAEAERLLWLEEELTIRQTELAASESQENWHRMSGIHSLNGAALPVARALWIWRDEQARARDIPPRRVLRDDLLVELARRGTSDAKRIANLRGMEHRHLKSAIDELAQVIESARQEPVPKWPRRTRYGTGQPPGMVTQFLGAALSYICKSRQIAPSIVGTAEDLRDFVLYRTERQPPDVPPPALLEGWRASIVGRYLDDLLKGKLGLALSDAKEEMPLRFCTAELPVEEFR